MPNDIPNTNCRVLNNKPQDDFLWKGLGGNFDSLTQIINEFVDNSLSDFIKHPENEIKQIFIKLEELTTQSYRVSIEDTGLGITDLDAAFSIGNTTGQESSLNEHGFGMKHALAAANQRNDNWKVITRTKDDAQNRRYCIIQAPFTITDQEAIVINDVSWPGKITTGTIVEFTVDKHWIGTIARGLRGNWDNLESYAEVLKEDLGYTYAYYINKSIASIQIQIKKASDSEFKHLTVAEVKPKFYDTISPGIGVASIDLGSGNVNFSYEFLQAEKSDYKKYYLANMSTSGVEIRVNGRVLESALFSEVWGIEKHNSYNYILIRINIESSDPNRLPSTTTTKTSLRRDDPKLGKILEWIRSKLTTPQKRADLSDHETDLFLQLADKKRLMLKEFDPALIVKTQQMAFQSIGENVRIDLYQSMLGQTTIYEGKRDKTSPQDVYQLLMYWDGLVMDDVKVDKAVLIAAEHPQSVKAMVEVKNNACDQKGKKYCIELKTWRDEDIKYPN